MTFAILIHPLESRRRIATGRMSHQCLEGSQLIEGTEFGDSTQVNRLIENPKNNCVILYPGPRSADLASDAASLSSSEKNLVMFVLDGTWATAGKMLHRSPNLMRLPRVAFTPSTPSNFRVRKQPHEKCYSTIEAIHHCLELIGENIGFTVSHREHDRLLTVFNFLVENQLEFIKKSGPPKYRRPTS